MVYDLQASRELLTDNLAKESESFQYLRAIVDLLMKKSLKIKSRTTINHPNDARCVSSSFQENVQEYSEH